MNKTIPKEAIEKLRSIPIQDLLGREFRQSSQRLTSHCPFHNPNDEKEKSQSFFIFPDNGYHCFSCGAHGKGAISFIIERDKVDFKKAVEILDPSISYNLEDSQQTPNDYLKSKGIDDSQTKEKYGISITKHYGVHPAIKFRIPTGFKYRRFGVEPKYMHAKGVKSCIFKSEENNSEIGYVNEGEIDSIVLNKYANVPAWCASTGGKSQTVFRENLNKFENFKKIYLLYHTDKTGREGARDVAKILGIERCSIVECPTKDWSDYFVTGYSSEDFQVLLDEAKPAQEVFETFIIAEQNADKTETAQECLLINNEEFLKKIFPKNPWLVQGVIRLKGFAAIAGPGGTGKSVFVVGLIKSVTEGKAWLDTFEIPVARKVLLIDRENDKENIQSNLLFMGVTSNNLYHALLSPLFQFTKQDEVLGKVLSEKALELKNYVIANNIEVIVLDSFVDFFEGNENDPVHIAKFAALYQEIFPDCCIIFIHHESKPAQNAPNRNPGDRLRGSTHIFNMLSSALSLRVNNLEKPEIIYVEHSKVRGGRKQKPFEVEMITEQDPNNEGDTVIRGFKYLGEAQSISKKVDSAKEEIMEIARSHPNEWFSTKQYKSFLKEKGIGESNIVKALNELNSSGELKLKKGDRNANFYKFNDENGNTDFDREKAEEFLKELEEENKDTG